MLQLRRIQPGIDLTRLGADDEAVVRAALRLLMCEAPEHHRIVVTHLLFVRYDSKACGRGAIACTAGLHARGAVFQYQPARLGVLETAVILSHEARHWVPTTRGWRVVHHTCGDCADLVERARDPIYRGDDALRHHLHAAVRRAHARQVRRNEAVFLGARGPWPDLLLRLG